MPLVLVDTLEYLVVKCMGIGVPNLNIVNSMFNSAIGEHKKDILKKNCIGLDLTSEVRKCLVGGLLVAHLMEAQQQKVNAKREFHVAASIACPYGVCTVIANSVHHLKKHFREVHNITSKAAVDKLLTKIEKINCPYCTETFTAMFSCIRHIELVCENSPMKIVCKFEGCYIRFKNEEEKKNHEENVCNYAPEKKVLHLHTFANIAKKVTKVRVLYYVMKETNVN